MVDKDGKAQRDGKPVKKSTAPPRVFFLGGELHKRLFVDRGNDLVRCWNYPQDKVVTHSWANTRRLMQPAFSTGQVVKLLNRSRVSIEVAILEGNIRKPYRSYSLPNKKPNKFFWQMHEIMEARDFFANRHIGYPRNDGMITAKAIPTRAELRAMMEHGITTYVRTSDGEFVPMYKEILW